MEKKTISEPQKTFPGGSKSRVSRAGDAIRSGQPSNVDLAVINEWREAHRHVLNSFQSLLRNRTRGSNIVVAQRQKRRSTIFDKLRRFPSMELARMDDVAGCRLIFESIADLYQFRGNLHKAKFKHRLRNEVNKWDYIKAPKTTGYRGVHDVYEYDANSAHGKRYKGLSIELQYRTQAQHAWATCVEVVGFVTASQPKFQEGDQRYERILSYASEMIARTSENSRSSHATLPNEELVRAFLDLDNELGFMRLLRGLNAANNDIRGSKNVILIISEGNALQTRTFRDATDAIRALFDLEKENPGKDIVLVRAETSDEVRVAFRNYFTDATEFIRLIDQSCQDLGGVKTIRAYAPKSKRVRQNQS